MPRWSSNAMTQMADLIRNARETADAVATLRNLINQWADAHPGSTLTKTFSGNGLRYAVSASISGGEVTRVEIL